MNAIVTHNDEDPIAAAIKKNLSEKLKSGMAELIPPEVYERLATEAVDAFLKGSTPNRMKIVNVYMDYNDPRNTTGKGGTFPVLQERPEYNVFEDTATLPGMIMAEIRVMAKETLVNHIKNDEKFQTMWNANTGRHTMQALDSIVKDNADLFVQAMFKNIVSTMMIPMINDMRNGRY